jgi:hypothetical protein
MYGTLIAASVNSVAQLSGFLALATYIAIDPAGNCSFLVDPVLECERQSLASTATFELLRAFGGKSQPSWPYGVTLNSAIPFLTAILRAFARLSSVLYQSIILGQLHCEVADTRHIGRMGLCQQMMPLLCNLAQRICGSGSGIRCQMSSCRTIKTEMSQPLL